MSLHLTEIKEQPKIILKSLSNVFLGRVGEEIHWLGGNLISSRSSSNDGEVEERIDLLFTLLHVLHLNNDNNEQYSVIGLESPFVTNFQSGSIVQKEDVFKHALQP